MMNDLDIKYSKLKAILTDLIDKAKYVCLTADGWMNRGRSFLGVTIHFFDDQLNKHSYILAFKRMYGRHTHEMLKDLLLSVIKEFKIDLSKITHIVTDGASNFKKAFDVFGSSNAIEPQNLNVESQNDVGTSEIDIGEPCDGIESEMYIPPDTECIELNLHDDSSKFEDDEDCDRLPAQRVCESHSLNRTGIDFDKSIEKNEKRGHEVLDAAFTKLTKFWTLTSRSSIAHEIVEQVCGRSFPRPIETRWNSKFDCIDLAEKHKSKINEAIEEINKEAHKNVPSKKKDKKLEKLSASEWRVLKDYVSCLRPVAMGLDILQGDKRSSQGYILPVFHGIKVGLAENISNRTYISEFGLKFHDLLLDCIDSRFGDKMKICEENKDLILAAAIHPNFKLSWLVDESDREYAQTLLINTCVDLSAASQQIEKGSDDNDSDDSANSNESIFFKHLKAGQHSRRSSNDDSITLEVYKYILQPANDPSIHEFRGSKILEDVFRRFNTTLSSSAAVERLFSKALIIFTPRRNRISDATFEKSLFVSQNEKILDYIGKVNSIK